MANHRSRIEKPKGIPTSILGFVNKNWQGIAIILGIVAVFVWYQALGLGTLFTSQQASLGTSDKTESTKQTPPKAPSEELKGEKPEVKKDTIAQALKIPITQPLAPVEAPVQASVRTGDVFIRKAEAGQGITHLARGALQDYLTSVKPQIKVSREQKIYIEDYLKDNVGSQKVTPGKEFSFSRESIAKAIELSQTLAPKDLSNLTQYASRVPSLQAYAPLQ